jgi:HTH DNA binding domain
MRNGSRSPGDYPGEVVHITCDRCGRAGRYGRDRLIQRYGAELEPAPRWRRSSSRANPTRVIDRTGAQSGAAQDLVAELELREMTGRRRYRAWGILCGLPAPLQNRELDDQNKSKGRLRFVGCIEATFSPDLQAGEAVNVRLDFRINISPTLYITT